MSIEAFILVLVAAAGHAAWNFAARKAAGDLVVIWLALWLAAIACAPAAAWFLITRSGWAGAWPCVLATGLVHSLYFALLGKAYETGEISVVYPIARGTGVAGVAVAAWLVLGEAISPVGAGGIAAICAGTALLSLAGRASRGPAHLRRAGGGALMVGATISAYSLIDKLGVGRMHPVPYVCGQFLLAAVFLTPYVAARFRPLRWRQRLRAFPGTVFLVGPGCLATYLLILFAFRLDNASYVVAAREVAVVLGAVLGFVFLKERPTWVRLAAIAAILAGLALIKLG